MTAAATRRQSIWLDTGPEPPAHPRLDRDEQADVAILGGGIVGITTALLLAEAGMDVVVLEANALARGVSGHTTAKVSSQHGLVYEGLRSTFGAEAACTYGEANQAALAWIAARVRADGIDCDLRRRPSFVYGLPGEDASRLEVEARAAVDAGLPASYVQTALLPFATEGAVRFDDQAEFHPRKYLLALAASASAAGARIYERSRAVEIDTDERCVVKVPGGRVTADRVVVATHYPFPDRSLGFARVHPKRSYALVCSAGGELAPGMFLSAGSPTRSVRAVPVKGHDMLLVGGEGHKPGTGGDTERHYAALERFAREHWSVQAVEWRWSTQDNTTVDSLPYIGSMTPRSDRVLMATGFNKWGMTNGTVAGLLLADLLNDRPNDWADLFDPNRFKPRAAARKLVSENAQAGLRFIGDRITKRGSRDLDDLEPGEGDITLHKGEKVAGHRRDDGSLVAVSPVCTHLGCQVSWNSAERSWDCPCHGSRFAPEGDVLHGPAVHRLEHKPIDGTA